MKKILFTIFSLVFVIGIYAQQAPPQGINYQAMVYVPYGNQQVGVNSAGQIPANTKQVLVKFTLEEGNNGPVIYEETHIDTTDQYGLLNTIIGTGTPTSNSPGLFNQIDWSLGDPHLRVSITLTQYNSTVSSYQKLWSVPYALYAGQANTADYATNSGHADSSDYADLAGNGITGVTDNGDGTLTFNYLDGSSYTTPVLTGLMGTPGPQGPQGIPGPAGQNGTNGQSAYDIWLAQGNTGTQQDFLDSLVGPPGTSNISKTYVVIAGDLTNSEAQQILQSDVGSNTQFIWILGTRQLTNIDLSGFNLQQLVELKILQNEDLTTVTVPDLTKIWYNLEVENNTNLTNISLPNVDIVYNVKIRLNPVLSILALPQLLSIRGNIEIYRNNLMNSISLPLLTSVGGYLKIEQLPNNSLINNLNLTNLANVGGAFELKNLHNLNAVHCPQLISAQSFKLENNVAYSSYLSTLNLPVLINSPYVYINCLSLNSINLISFQTGSLTINNTQITSLNLPNWTSSFSNFFNGNTLLSQLITPALNQANQLYFNNNLNLTAINFPSLNGYIDFSLGGGNGITQINSSTFPLIDTLRLNCRDELNITTINMPSVSVMSIQASTPAISFIDNNPLLNSISFPNLIKFIGANGFECRWNLNPQLTNININNLVDCGNMTQFNTQSMSLSVNTVNNLLNTFATTSPQISGVTIRLNGQTPSAPPSGQGITDKATLISNGNSVMTD